MEKNNKIIFHQFFTMGWCFSGMVGHDEWLGGGPVVIANGLYYSSFISIIYIYFLSAMMVNSNPFLGAHFGGAGRQVGQLIKKLSTCYPDLSTWMPLVAAGIKPVEGLCTTPCHTILVKNLLL